MQQVRTCTIDLETTIRNTIGNNKASPFCKDNFVVMAGRRFDGISVIDTDLSEIEMVEPYDYIVGQNFKFDIHYIRRDNYPLYEQLIRIDWWDTQVAEYILTAQQHKYASLDQLSEKYGGTQKEDKIKEYWDNGIDTTEIPEDMLEEYLIADLENTELVAHKQMEIAKGTGQFDLIVLMSNCIKAYADMEYNGLQVDVDTLREVKDELNKERDEIRDDLYTDLYIHNPNIPHAVWNIDSNLQLSAILFGGEIKWKFTEVVGQKEIQRNVEKVPNGIIKSGPNKGKTKYSWLKEKVMVDVKETNEGEEFIHHLGLKGKAEWANNNGYSTSDEILSTILNRAEQLKRKPTKVIDFLTKILRLRFLNKQIDTYCTGLENLIYPDGKIHHNLNNVATATSRLSCLAPSEPITTQRGEIPIKNVVVGDFVWTHRGRWRPVIAHIQNPQADLYEVKFSNGNVLTCTMSHSMLQSNGEWVTLQESITKGLNNVIFKDLGEQSRQLHEGYKTIQEYRPTNNRGSSKRAEDFLPECTICTEAAYARSGTLRTKEASLCCLKGGSKESYVPKNWSTASQIYRGSFGLQRVSYLSPRGEEGVCSQSSDGEGAWYKYLTLSSDSTSHRWKPFKQRAEQLSSMYSKGASRDTLLTKEGQSYLTIEEVNYKGSSAVFDLTVLEDSSYLSGSVFSHNCSSPNMQNIPRKGDTLVKKFFTSRFGEQGRIIQVDYSQLEVVWQAFVTGDKNLQQGIKDGIDFHCMRLAKKEGLSYEEVFNKCKVEEDEEWGDKRSNIKVFTFQRAYGAGAKAISKATGMHVAEVKKLIQNELELYPDVEGHFLKVKALAEREMVDEVGYYKSLTGRKYAYPVYDNMYGRNMSPTQLRNYDIQGGATGDLVPAYIYSLFNKIALSKNKDKVFLINTVHDSILLDVHESLCYGVCKVLKEYLEDTSILKEAFNIDFNIPLKVDVEYGKNWKELSTFKN